VDITGKSEEFEKLWRESVDRAGRRPGWSELSLAEQKNRSSQFRTEMDRYGSEDPIAADRTGTGLYGSPTNSSSPGSTPG
jgi:hypothetical protein